MKIYIKDNKEEIYMNSLIFDCTRANGKVELNVAPRRTLSLKRLLLENSGADLMFELRQFRFTQTSETLHDGFVHPTA